MCEVTEFGSTEDDGWSDDADALEAPKYDSVCVVIKDYIPESNAHLTLILDDLVYVFKKESSVKGFW